MLDEDISRGVGGIGNATGRAIGSAIRGAVMIGALAVVAGAFYFAWPSIVAGATLIGHGSILTGLGTALLHGTTAGVAGATVDAAGLLNLTAMPAILSWLGWGAAAGAATFGVTSLLPGMNDMSKVRHVVPRSVAQGMSGPSQERARAPEIDNPYAQTGHAAALQERDAAAQAAGAGRV